MDWLDQSNFGWDEVKVPEQLRTMVDTVWDQLTPLSRPGVDEAAARAADTASADAAKKEVMSTLLASNANGGSQKAQEANELKADKENNRSTTAIEKDSAR